MSATTTGIYGPNTEAVQAIIDRISTLTKDEIDRLSAAWDAAYDATWNAAWNAARNAAYDAARHAAWNATRNATWKAPRNEDWSAAYDEACDAAWSATLVTVTYDLATEDGPYTIAQRDLLLAPWVEVTA